MVSVPGFLLRRLYVKKSLRNTADGFEFQLKNGLGSGYAYRLWPLTLDGEEIPSGRSVFSIDGREVGFDDVSRENTFTLAMNKTVTISIQGISLDVGAHKVRMGFDVPGLGTLRFDFTDVVSDE